MLRLGIVGLGRWSKVLIDCIDFYSPAQAKITQYINKEDYLNGDTFEIKLSKIDALIVCTPIHTHGSVILRALNSRTGLPIFVEKPITTSWHELSLIDKKKQEHPGTIIFTDYIDLYRESFKSVLSKFIPNKLYSVDIQFGQKSADWLWDWAGHALALSIDFFGIPGNIHYSTRKNAHHIKANYGVFDVSIYPSNIEGVKRYIRFNFEKEMIEWFADYQIPMQSRLVFTDVATGKQSEETMMENSLRISLQNFIDSVLYKKYGDYKNYEIARNVCLLQSYLELQNKLYG